MYIGFKWLCVLIKHHKTVENRTSGSCVKRWLNPITTNTEYFLYRLFLLILMHNKHLEQCSLDSPVFLKN